MKLYIQTPWRETEEEARQDQNYLRKLNANKQVNIGYQKARFDDEERGEHFEHRASLHIEAEVLESNLGLEKLR